MKILINAISAKKGGIVTYTGNLARALQRRGVDFRIAVPQALAGIPNALPVSASEYGPVRRFLWEQTGWRRLVERWKPDILFSSANYALLNSNVPQVLLVREGGLLDSFYIAMIAPEQGVKAAILREMRRKLILTSVAHSDRVLVPTEAVRTNLLSYVPAVAGKCDVSRYGTLLDVFRTTPRRPWRTDGVLRILYVSVYYPRKSPADLVLAAEQLVAEGVPCRVRLTMEEREIEQSLGSAWDLFHVRRGVAQGLVELGPVNYADLPEVYRTHDVFAFPSISETFGHPMAEALAAGIPILAADTPVNREVLGDAALYHAPLRPSAFAAVLRRLDADPTERDRLIASGRKRAETMLDWESHVDHLLRIFEDVSRARRRGNP